MKQTLADLKKKKDNISLTRIIRNFKIPFLVMSRTSRQISNIGLEQHCRTIIPNIPI